MEFKPTITTAAGGRIKIIDPNPPGRENIHEEDLKIFVDLSTSTKSRSIIVGTEINNVGSTGFNTIHGSQDYGNFRKQSTDWTSIGTVSIDGEVAESLGITSIDIDFNVNYTPLVNIKFVDVRGSDLYSRGIKSPYAAFFEFPYPLFTLTLKGYFGRTVKLCLHMIKFNASFNSSTGNFEMAGEFIGYTFAFLPDMLIGYLKGVVETPAGKMLLEKAKQEDPELITLLQYIEKVKQLNVEVEKLKEENDLKQLKLLEEQSVEIDSISTLLNTYISDLKTDTPIAVYNSRIIKSANNGGDVESFNSFVDMISSRIRSFNENAAGGPTVDGSKISTSSRQETTYSSLSIRSIPEQSAFSTVQIAGDTKVIDYDLNPIQEEIIKVIADIKKVYTEHKTAVAEKINDISTAQIGFDPSIGFFFKILCKHVDIFMQCMKDVSIAAEQSNSSGRSGLRSQLQAKVNTDLTNNNVIYPWPDYYVNNQETWIGDIAPTMPEVIFVQDMLDGILKSQGDEQDLLNNVAGEQVLNYPVNPLDAPMFSSNGNVYALEELGNSLDVYSVIEMIVARAFIFLNYSFRDITKEDLEFFATAEAVAVYKGLQNQDIKKWLNNLAKDLSLKVDMFLNIAGDLENGKIKAVIDNGVERKIKRLGVFYETQASKLEQEKNPNLKDGIYNYAYKSISREHFGPDTPFFLPINHSYKSSPQLNMKPGDIQRVKEMSSGLPPYNETYAVAGGGTDLAYYSGGIYVKIFNESDLQIPTNTFYSDIGVAPTDKFSSPLGFYAQTGQEVLPLFYSKDDTHFFLGGSRAGLTNYLEGKEVVGHGIVRHLSDQKDGPSVQDFHNSIHYRVDGFDFDHDTSHPLFTSPLFTDQPTEFNKAFLFLHTLPFNGMMEDQKGLIDPFGETINIIGDNAGIYRVPYAWALFMGGLLWRMDQSAEDIIVYSGSSGMFVKDTEPPVTSYYYIRSEGSEFLSFDSSTLEYVRIEDAIINMPLQARDEFKNLFVQWVNDKEGWKKLYTDINSAITNRDTKKFNNIFLGFMVESRIMMSSTYRIWENKTNENFEIAAANLKNYVTVFMTKYTELMESQQQDDVKSQLKRSIFNTIDDRNIRLNLYRNFKSIYDKWIAGTSAGNACIGSDGNLYDRFVFIDRAYHDISTTLYLNPVAVVDTITSNFNQNFFDLTSRVLSPNNVDFIPLPIYVNLSNDEDLIDMFTVYSYNKMNQEGPTFMCMYVGGTSNSLDLGVNASYPNDGFDILPNYEAGIPTDFSDPHPVGSSNINDLTTPTSNVSSSIPVVMVNYGDENQSIFKDIKLDQSEFSETDESLRNIEEISQRGNPNNKTTIGQNLFNVYLKRSYSCEIECMGNMMIQPMMYFQLNNIPMFHGAYKVIKVTHSFRPNYASTRIKGQRMRKVMVPLIDENVIYMNLLGSIDSVSSEGATITPVHSQSLNSNAYLDPATVSQLGFGNPLRNVVVTSPFGPRKPIKGDSGKHPGIDLAATYGTEVFAVGDGVIDSIRVGGGYGLHIIISHDKQVDGKIYRSLYAHLSDVPKTILDLDTLTAEQIKTLTSKTGIALNKHVKIGQLIGATGGIPGKRSIGGEDFAGHVSGAHLHFEIRSSEKKVNYYTVKATDPLPLIPGGENAKFAKKMVEEGSPPVAEKLIKLEKIPLESERLKSGLGKII